MQRAVVGLIAVGLLLGGAAAHAETALMFVTPQNIKEGTFRLSSKVARNNTVQFVIRRDVSKVSGPSESGYVSEGKAIGIPVKLEKDGKIWTFRFAVPVDRVESTLFTLWGGGRIGEGITYRFELGQFSKPNRE